MTAWTLLSLLLGRLLILQRHLCNLELSPCWGFKWPSRPPLPPGVSDPFTPYILRTAALHFGTKSRLFVLILGFYQDFTASNILHTAIMHHLALDWHLRRQFTMHCIAYMILQHYSMQCNNARTHLWGGNLTIQYKRLTSQEAASVTVPSWVSTSSYLSSILITS